MAAIVCLTARRSWSLIQSYREVEIRSEARSRLRRCALITGSALLTLVLGVVARCVGLPANVANLQSYPDSSLEHFDRAARRRASAGGAVRFPVDDFKPGKWRQCSLAGTHRRNRDAAGPDLYRSPLRRWLRSALLASHQHQPVDLDAQRTTHR